MHPQWLLSETSIKFNNWFMGYIGQRQTKTTLSTFAFQWWAVTNSLTFIRVRELKAGVTHLVSAESWGQNAEWWGPECCGGAETPEPELDSTFDSEMKEKQKSLFETFAQIRWNVQRVKYTKNKKYSFKLKRAILNFTSYTWLFCRLGPKRKRSIRW